MTQWKVMTETSKPIKGFTYECPEGHQWFIPLAEWEARGENTCVTCEVAVQAALEAAQAEGMA